MTAFMPPSLRKSMEQMLAESVAGEASAAKDDGKKDQKGRNKRQSAEERGASVEEKGETWEIKTEGGVLDIGGVRMVQDEPRHLALLPNVVFFDIPKHVHILREMLKVPECAFSNSRNPNPSTLMPLLPVSFREKEMPGALK